MVLMVATDVDDKEGAKGFISGLKSESKFGE